MSRQEKLSRSSWRTWRFGGSIWFFYSLLENIMADRVRLSKFLAVLLRHEADKFGLALDADGFTDTDAVWEQINRRYPGKYSYNDLLAVVEGDDTGKKRYEIRGRRIRALFGH